VKDEKKSGGFLSAAAFLRCFFQVPFGGGKSLFFSDGTLVRI
jgi:hypothetical protein